MIDLSQRPEPFRDELGPFINIRTYARWIEEQERREKWWEEATRAVKFLLKHSIVNGKSVLSKEDQDLLTNMLFEMETLCSMRLLWSAGPCAEKNNITAYNCAYQATDSLRAFDEELYILMCGCGHAWSAESEVIEDLPKIVKPRKKLIAARFVIDDTKEGWAEALRHTIETVYEGGWPDLDDSQLRGPGARLKTMGGRSSGPEPLRRLLAFTAETIRSRAGRRLRSDNVADIHCMIGQVTEMGGVRRASELGLTSLDDDNMRHFKQGAFYNTNPHRMMANISVAYDEKPGSVDFMKEWLALAESRSGERGIFNRESVINNAPRRKKLGNDSGTNPCGEINLRSKEFCNLSTVVLRPDETMESLKRKVRMATIIGTIQATLTDFPYLREEWRKNCEEERLLGVSLLGQADTPLLNAIYRAGENIGSESDFAIVRELKEVAVETNREYADKLGINRSAAITCGKPDGTSSKLVCGGSGAHTWWSKFFLQNIRISATDPLCDFVRSQGVPAQPETGQDPINPSTWVLQFPRKAPEGSITRHDVSAQQQLEHWLKMSTGFCEHNQSQTIYVSPNEWGYVMNWVYEHWSVVGGLSFLPTSDHVYKLAPYEEITEAEYNRLMETFPKHIDYSLFVEKDDNTTGAQSGACSGDLCERP